MFCMVGIFCMYMIDILVRSAAVERVWRDAAIAIFVAVEFDRMSEPAFGTAILPQEIAVGLAPAVAITAMQILGLTHPPAGAAVLGFLFYPLSIREMGLLFYVPVYLGCFILVLMALVINNAFSFRPAYPRFW